MGIIVNEAEVRAKAFERLCMTADLLAARARMEAPVDTGALWQSIDVLEMAEDQAAVGSDLYYAAFVEWGTHHEMPSGLSYDIPPNPFLRRALALSLDDLALLWNGIRGFNLADPLYVTGPGPYVIS